MGIEIERKFLVTGGAWKQAEAVYICQGYLSTDQRSTVRIRIAGNQGFLTIKGPTSIASRMEFEYEIPLEDAKELMGLCVGPRIEKYRRRVHHGQHTWEVDEFLGDNLGLIVAEVELTSESEPIELPTWVGAEVTDDARYFNSNLARTPFRHWPTSSV